MCIEVIEFATELSGFLFFSQVFSSLIDQPWATRVRTAGRRRPVAPPAVGRGRGRGLVLVLGRRTVAGKSNLFPLSSSLSFTHSTILLLPLLSRRSRSRSRSRQRYRRRSRSRSRGRYRGRRRSRSRDRSRSGVTLNCPVCQVACGGARNVVEHVRKRHPDAEVKREWIEKNEKNEISNSSCIGKEEDECNEKNVVLTALV